MKPIDETFHFAVGNIQFDDKLDAIQENIKTGDPIRLRSPVAYSNFDLSKEPSDSFETMLKHEAEKIRDTHKTIRVYYSGGCDSKLMLQTFVKHNIHIDEIVVAKSGIEVSDFEQNDYALPFLKSLHLPNTKVTIKSHSPQDYLDFHSLPMDEKISRKMITWDTQFRLGMQQEFYREERFDPEIANVHGYDKPRIINVNDHWYTYWMDVNIEPTKHVYQFYSSNPALHCKQAHMFLNELNDKQTASIPSDPNYKILQDSSTARETTNVPRKTRYGGKNDYIQHKNKQVFYTNYKEKAALEYATKHMPDAVENWIHGLDFLQEFTNNTWWNQDRPELGTISVFSNFYCLTKHQTTTADDLFANNNTFANSN